MKNQSAFAIVPVDILDLGLKQSALIVFVALASFAGKSRIVWPSVRTVAQMVGMQDRSVRRHISELEEAGVISRVHRFDEGGRQMSNAYRLDILVSRLADRTDPPDTPDPDPADRGEGDSPVSQTVPEGTIPEKQDTTARDCARLSAGELKVEFEDWYQHYPRKVARGQAEQAFAKAWRGGEKLETLIAGAKRYSAQVAGKELRYVRYPATWLNGKCWLDEPEPPAGVGPDGKLTWWQRRELEEQLVEERALSG